VQLKDREDENRRRNRAIRSFVLERRRRGGWQPARLYLAATAGGHAGRRAALAHRGAAKDELRLSGGGEVVGRVPEGLPSIAMPRFSPEMLTSLLSAAMVIALVGFMEAISIAKAMAAKTGRR